ncbi:MAG: hypothetical protein ACFFC7_25185 [Candidatus Hermodarchaeota archaeon]
MADKPILATIPDHYFDIIAIGICFVYLIILWVIAPPMHHDTQYHLAVARMFYQNGGITLWDTLQYQPIGRPHLYPPFVHVLLWGLTGLFGGDSFLVARIALSLIWPILLLSVWFLARQLKDSRTGLFSLVAASSIIGMFNLSSFIMPTTICLIFQNILLWSVMRQKDDRRFLLSSTILLSLICWSHISFLFIPIITLTSYSIVQWYATKDRDYLLNLLINVFGALLLYSPWLIHVLLHFSWFHVTDNTFQAVFGLLENIAVPIILVLLALPAIYRVIKTRNTIDFIFIAPLIGMLAMVPYAHRFWPYFSFYLAFFVGITITEINEFIKSLENLLEKLFETLKLKFRLFMKALPIFVFLVFILSSFTFYPAIKHGFVLGAPFYPYIPTSSVITPTPAIVITDWVIIGRNFQPVEIEVMEVSKWINEHLSQDELIHLIGPATGGPFACGLIMLTGNPVTAGQWDETVPQWVRAEINAYLKNASGFFLCRGSEYLPQGAVIRATFTNELIMAYRP